MLLALDVLTSFLVNTSDNTFAPCFLAKSALTKSSSCRLISSNKYDALINLLRS